jgi:ATP-binding cassette subfamily B protein
MLKRFVSYYRPHKGLLILDMVTAALGAALAVTVPYLVREVLAKDLPAGDMRLVGFHMAAMLALVLAMSLTGYINMKWGHILGTRMETDMRRDLFRHLQKLSFSYFDNTKTGHIMSRISNDLFTISEVAHHAPEDLFISFCMIVGAFAFMLSFNAKLALITFLPLPVMVGWGIVYRGRMKRGFRQVRKKIADINSSVENSIQGIREVKSFAKEEHVIDQFGEVNGEFRVAKERMYGVMAGFHSGMRFFSEAYTLVVIGGGALLMHAGEVSLADVVAFLLYVRFILNPIQRLVNFAEQYQQGTASFERFVEIMDEKPDIQDRPDAVGLPRVKGEIEIRDLSFRYGSSSDWVLRGINLRVPAGQTVALVGESGAGKSTLAALIPRFYEPIEGHIKIDGHDILALEQRCLRENIGLVQQNVFLFDASIRENIVFGRPDATEEELVQAARSANIYEFIMSLPEGFDSLVGEHGVKLSGGQKQRVSIARVFLKNPPILIFDEATSSLDTESERLIQESLESLCRNRSTIVIAHRLSTVKNAGYTYVLQDGRIAEEGSHEDLLKARGYYYELYANSLF